MGKDKYYEEYINLHNAYNDLRNASETFRTIEDKRAYSCFEESAELFLKGLYILKETNKW